MAADLLALLSLEPGRTDALDWFIGNCLCEGVIWESPRTSDGIKSIERVIEREANVLRVCGRIWEIDQSVHAFWLDLKRDGADDRFVWFLYFDLIETSPRRAQNALNSNERAEDIEWRATLAGEATVQDNALTIVPGSTRVLVRDKPESEPSQQQRERRRHRRH